MVEADEQFILNEEALDELYAWIDTIPLTRPKKNIARDFSDGVLCAEAVSYFMPKLVDTHNYFAASSAMQKKINWSTLNRKVFQKLGIRLTDATIQQLIEARPGAIEQVLWDIRRKVLEQPSSRQPDHRQDQLSGRQQEQRSDPRQEQRRASSAQGRPKAHNPTPNPVRPGTGYQQQQQQQQQQYQPDSDYLDSPPAAGPSSSRGGMGSSGNYQATPSNIPMPISYKERDRPEITSYKAAAPNESYQSYQSQGQGYIAAPGRSPSVVSTTETYNNNSSAPPTQIVYRGHKMVSLLQLEEKEREMKSKEEINKNLVTKCHRIETLVNVKDQRIEDLTHQLHNLRAMYERVTQQTWQGF